MEKKEGGSWVWGMGGCAFGEGVQQESDGKGRRGGGDELGREAVQQARLARPVETRHHRHRDEPLRAAATRRRPHVVM